MPLYVWRRYYFPFSVTTVGVFEPPALRMNFEQSDFSPKNTSGVQDDFILLILAWAPRPSQIDSSHFFRLTVIRVYGPTGVSGVLTIFYRL